ncbi:hypothetical protein, partial [Priestia megaterium]|uniref:hypothetical protein n=1 Tax=Priestia megaterium TaxID=1404 RepID=UPI00128EE313
MKTSTGYKTIAATAAAALTAGLLGAMTGTARADEPTTATVVHTISTQKLSCDATPWLAPGVTEPATVDLNFYPFSYDYPTEVKDGEQIEAQAISATVTLALNAQFMKNSMKATDVGLTIDGMRLTAEGAPGGSVALPAVELESIPAPVNEFSPVRWTDREFLLPAYTASDTNADGWSERSLTGPFTVTASVVREGETEPTSL